MDGEAANAWRTPVQRASDHAADAGQGIGAGEREGGTGRRIREAFERATAEVNENDGALVIFTTGSTGSPKPACSRIAISPASRCASARRSSGVIRGMRTLVNCRPPTSAVRPNC